MKRYYVCDIIGDGQSPETAYRPAIADIVDPQTHLRAFEISVESKVNPDGTPALPWCLVIAAGQNHALADGVQGIDGLPDYPLDVRLSAMHTPTKLAAFARLSARGVDTTSLSNADGYRDVVRTLGRLHNSIFDEDAFDV